jgi:protein-S-isoprenylcysteine O-methyltransferase Ste14
MIPMNDSFFQRGGGWVIGQFLFLVPIVHLGVMGLQQPAIPLLRVCGLVFLGISALCGISGTIALGRHLTPFPKPVAQGRLVRRGIYALMRHPLYTAVMSATAGWSLFCQSWPALAVSGVLAVFLDAKARREERWLREQFPEYADYQRRVRRFIPWIY